MKWLFIATRKRYYDALHHNLNGKANVYRIQLEVLAGLIDMNKPESWEEIKSEIV